MKKLISKIILFSIIINILHTVGMASDNRNNVETHFNGFQGSVTVSGQFWRNSNAQIALKLIEKNQGVTVYYNQITTDENGKYSIDFTLNESGEYILQVMSNIYFGTYLEKEFVYYSPQEISMLWNSINGLGNSLEIKNNWNKISYIFNLRLTYFNLFQNSDPLFEEIAKKNDFGSLTEENVLNFVDYIENSAVLCGFQYSENESELLNAVNMLKEHTGFIQMPKWSIYSAMSNESKLKTFNYFINEERDFNNFDDIKIVFTKAIDYEMFKILISLVENADNHTVISSVLNVPLNAEYLGVTDYIDEYNALSNKSLVDKAIVGKRYATKEEFSNAFRNALNSAKENETQTPTPISTSKSNLGGGISIAPGIGEWIPAEKDETVETHTLFNDIENLDWAKNEIIILAKMGIVNGKSEGKFAPDDSITREEFVKIIVEALGLKTGQSQLGFSDVDASAWYAPYIGVAVDNGIIFGKDGKFGIGESITRQDMAVIIVRALNAMGYETTADAEVIRFDDYDQIDGYASEAIAWLYKNSIVFGISEELFAPKETSTRAQAACISYRILNKIGKIN